jgi:2-phospho-L-lactate transferase/gluconeogenesis factor (CofD/UPF0052 family)
MKVLIFSGGSGSAALQEGLLDQYPELDISVLLNAYDNGKSTGEIRKKFNGKILGPSDVRKNQSRLFKLTGGDRNVSDFLEYRFNSSSKKEAYEIISSYYKDIRSEKNKFILDKLMLFIEEYFLEVKDSAYDDFSIGNIIYGYLAHKNDNSLQNAADIMKEILGLKHNVILNSDESLYLQAITKSGKILYDEADIVEYNDENNPIVDIRFKDSEGNIVEDSFLCGRAITEIRSADIIIFSTGTQWSSLIPTYKCYTEEDNFRDILKSSNAKKYLLINGTEDKDMIGLNGDDILKILNNYFNINECVIVAGENKLTPSKTDLLLQTKSEKYGSDILASSIISHFFNNPSKDDIFVFDWDDTIHGRNNSFKFESTFNLNYLNDTKEKTYIVSGNSYHNIKTNNIIYADGGVNKYTSKFKQNISPETFISDDVYNKISRFVNLLGLNQSIIQNRGNVCISLKPIQPEYRRMFKYVLEKEFIANDIDLNVNITGKTTVDIQHKNNNKLTAIEDIIKDNPNKRIFFIGDELFEGNDNIIYENAKDLNIICIPVNNPCDTSVFLKAIR